MLKHRLHVLNEKYTEKPDDLNRYDQRKVLQAVGGDEYAMGTIGGLDALQSCNIPSGRSGVTRQTLEQLTLPQPIDRRDLTGSLRRLAGLRSNRSYECVLVTHIQFRERS
jgi:hypothetical protein